MKLLNLNAEQFCILHWLTILLQNREFDTPSGLVYEAKAYLLENFKVDYSAYDAIIGYRADDSYFSFAQDFINGTISYRQLNNAMHLGKLGQQFVLKSRKAFSLIKFTGYELAEVPLRTVQQYEQRQKNINRAQAETLARIAKQLYCNIEDLLEKV